MEITQANDILIIVEAKDKNSFCMGMNFKDNCLLLPSSKATEKSLPHPTFFLWDHPESWAYDYICTLSP